MHSFQTAHVPLEHGISLAVRKLGVGMILWITLVLIPGQGSSEVTHEFDDRYSILDLHVCEIERY